MSYTRYGIVVFLAAGVCSGQSSFTQSPTDSSTPASLAPGTPDGSYHLSDTESVNPFNLGLNFTVPLLSIGGRGKAGYTMLLPIQHQWDAGNLITPQGQTNDQVLPYIGSAWWSADFDPYGPGVVIGRSGYQVSTCAKTQNPLPDSTLTTITFVEPNGTEHLLIDTATNGVPWSISEGSTPTAPLPTCAQIPPNPAPSRGTVFEANDGSAMTFYSNAAIVDSYNYVPFNGSGSPSFYPSGQLVFSTGVIYDFYQGRVDWIRDPNGNTTSFERISGNPTHEGEIEAITDALNRTVSIAYGQTCTRPLPGGGAVPSSETCDLITYTGNLGVSRPIQIAYAGYTSVLRSDYGAETVNQLFPGYGFPDEVAFDMPAAVTLANGQGYQFLYNSYGDLARATLPTGGAFEYDWVGFPNSGGGLSYHPSGGTAVRRGVSARRVYSSATTNTSLIRTDSYAQTPGTGLEPVYGQLLNSTVTETTTDGSGNGLRKVIHDYYGDQSNLGPPSAVLPQLWQEGKEYETDVVSLASNATLQVSQSVWQSRNPDILWNATVPNSSNTTAFTALNDKPAVCQTNTTIDGVTSGKVMVYDWATEYNNVVDLYEYDFGQAPAITSPLSFPACGSSTNYLRHTNKTYVTGGYDTTPNVHLRDLAQTETVYAPGGLQAADTVYSYDTAPLQSLSGAATGVSPAYTPGNPFVSPDATRRGNLNTVQQWWNTPTKTESPRLTSYLVDSLGNTVQKTDALGYPTYYSFADNFDSSGGPSSGSTFAFPTIVTNAAGQATHYQYDYWIGRPTQIKDPNGAVTNAQYSDSLDRLTQVTPPVGSVTYSYLDTPGSVSVSKTSAQSSCASSNSLVSAANYDGLGRETSAVATGDGSTTVTTATTYDGLDRVLTKTLPYYGSSGSCATTYSYDALSRELTTKDCDGATTYIGYEAGQSSASHQTISVDPAGIWKAVSTDGLGRTSQVVEDPSTPGTYVANNPIPAAAPGQSGGSHAGTNVLTKYQYDVLDDLSLVQQTNQTRTFTYDSLKQLATATNPESGLTSYTYDANGNVATKQDNRSITTNFVYDNLNRLTGKTYSDGTPSVSMVYDQNEAPAGFTSYPIGRLSEVSVSGGSATSFYYNNMGWALGSTQTTSGQSFSFYYGYNQAGGLETETYPSLRQVKTCYDSLARATGVTGSFGTSSTPYVSSVTYEPDGQLSGQTLGNGLSESIGYNQRLQPTSFGLTGPGKNVLSLGFAYTSAGLTNNNGNVWSQTITNLGATQTYTYDPLNRLSSATETAGSSTTWYQNYGYDNYGNRWVPSSSITLSGLTPTSSTMIDPATNRLIGSNYLFDLAGNQKFVSPWAMTFDAESRITGFTSTNNGSGTYTYDGEGRRVLKTVGATTTLYVYDAQGNRAAEYASAVAAPPCATCYETVDTVGSLRAVTDGFGNTIALHDYLPFGEELSTANRSGVPGYGISDGLVDRFTGKERDAESGLDYFGARYMSSAQGRFTSVDPDLDLALHLSDPQGWNGYAYARNNPLKYTDPSGENYTVCDTNGKNCADLTDSQYNDYLKSSSSIYQTAGGSLYSVNQDGSDTKVGSATYYNEKDVAGAAQIGASQLLINEFAKQAAINAVAGVAGRLIGAGVEAFFAARAASTAAAAVDVANLSNKIVRQMASRGWTAQEIVETVQNGKAYGVINKATGGAATEYINPANGKFVVVDNATKQVLQVSGPGFSPNHLGP